MEKLDALLNSGFTLLSQLTLGILVFVFVLLFIVYLIRFVLLKQLKSSLETGQLLLVRLPHYKTVTSDPTREDDAAKAAEQLFNELHGRLQTKFKSLFIPQPSFSFEIWADHQSISFYVHSPKSQIGAIANAINSYYPDAEVTQVENPLKDIKNIVATQTKARVDGPLYAPIRTFDSLIGDTLNTLTSKLARLHEGEYLIIQFLVRPTPNNWRSRALKTIGTTTRQTQGESTQQNINSQVSTTEIHDVTLEKSIQEKTNKNGFNAIIRVTSLSPDSQRSLDNLNNTTSSFSQFDLPPVSRFAVRQPRIYRNPNLNKVLSRSSHLTLFSPPRPFPQNVSLLNTQELASLYHFPSQFLETAKINWLPAKKAPAPANLPQEGTILGKNYYRGQTQIIKISKKDRQRHLYILGQTGTGKTELGKYLFLQDVYDGHGACFIDPHGDAATDLLSKIPIHRLKDVVYFDPTNTQNPPGFNILNAQTPEEKQIVINSFISLLYKLYDPNHQGMIGPLLERAVRNVMLTAMEEEDNTLVEVLRLLTSPEFAATKIPLIKDPLVKTYWTEELAQTSDFHKSETLGYFTSKFDHFVTDPTIRNIIGQGQSTFSLKDIMNNQKILIINLAKGVIGTENASFLGLLLIPHLLIAAMSRANLPEDQRHDFYLYVDEFQNFATPDFIQILSEARKFHLNLTLLNQYLDQVPKDIIDAVFGNVGSFVSFRVGIDDAEKLEQKFAPVFNRYDLSNNIVGNFYIKTLIDGVPTSAFSTTLDWADVQALPKSDLIKQVLDTASTILYTLPVDIIKQSIKQKSGLET